MNHIYNLPLRTVTSTHLKNPEIMKADSGASNTYSKAIYSNYLEKQQTLKNGPIAILPNNEKIKATMLGKLPIHKDFSIGTLVYPQLNNKSLLSIGQLCDNDCVVIFEKH